MKWRVYNEKNYSETARMYFHTYFKTKKEALAYASTIENPIVEKKLVSTWVLVK